MNFEQLFFAELRMPAFHSTKRVAATLVVQWLRNFASSQSDSSKQNLPCRNSRIARASVHTTEPTRIRVHSLFSLIELMTTHGRPLQQDLPGWRSQSKETFLNSSEGDTIINFQHSRGPLLGGKVIVPYTVLVQEGRMTVLTITAKGQVTLKQDLLKHLGVSPGEKIEADKLPDGRIVVRAMAQDGAITDFVGCLARRRGPKLTIDEINEIAMQGWAKAK